MADILSHRGRYNDTAFLYRRAKEGHKIFGKRHPTIPCGVTEKFKSTMGICFGVGFINEAMHECIHKLFGLVSPLSLIVVCPVVFAAKLVDTGAWKDC
jgi:hypothetical protein